MRLNKLLAGTSRSRYFLTIGFASESRFFGTFAQGVQTAKAFDVAVGPQYDTTHVYVAPQDFERFVTSVVATFGGTTSKLGVFTVTPTASEHHVATGHDSCQAPYQSLDSKRRSRIHSEPSAPAILSLIWNKQVARPRQLAQMS